MAGVSQAVYDRFVLGMAQAFHLKRTGKRRRQPPERDFQQAMVFMDWFLEQGFDLDKAVRLAKQRGLPPGMLGRNLVNLSVFKERSMSPGVLVMLEDDLGVTVAPDWVLL